MSKQLKAPEVGAFVLHLPSGTAGRVVAVTASGATVPNPRVELSTGDVFLLESSEERAGDAAATWLRLPLDRESVVAAWVRDALPVLERLAREAEAAGLSREWAHRLLAALAREALPLKAG